MLLNISTIETNYIQDSVFEAKKISLSVIRLDKIHPAISGNKLFKLHYFLQDAHLTASKTVLSFGGAYSNHLVALAHAAKLSGLKSIGIVRGEKPPQLSHSLQYCIANGMQLKFILRNDYEKKDSKEFIKTLVDEFGNATIIPEGGYHPLGAKGAALIMQYIGKAFTHICCATGTATTIAGLLMAAEKHQQIVAVPVLKGMNDIAERVTFLNGSKSHLAQLKILNDYHLGGYAKKTPQLISFMNMLYSKYQLPTDFVYTGKMLFGVFDALQNDVFAPGSKIACLHTGGLQGNLSLPQGCLIF